MLNKRGADVGTIVVFLIIAVLAGVVLIIGFTQGWSTFTAWLSPGNNVNTISAQCQTSCATTDAYGFCTMKRTLKSSDLPKGQIESNCHDFATNSIYDSYNFKIADCPSLCG